MREDTFTALLWRAFVAVRGPFVGVAGLAATLLAWGIAPLTKLSVVWFVVLACAAVLIAATLGHAAFLAFRSHTLPLVLAVRDFGGGTVCLLAPSPLYAFDAAVGLFLESEGFEIYIANGHVQMIQDNGKIQVIVEQWRQGHDDAITKIRSNDKSVLARLRVKPFVPYDRLTDRSLPQPGWKAEQ